MLKKRQTFRIPQRLFGIIFPEASSGHLAAKNLLTIVLGTLTLFYSGGQSSQRLKSVKTQ